MRNQPQSDIFSETSEDSKDALEAARREAFSQIQILVQRGNYVSALDEYASRLKIKKPVIVKERSTGPARRRSITLELSFKDLDKRIYLGSGEGLTMKAAGMLAAKEIYGQLLESIETEPKAN